MDILMFLVLMIMIFFPVLNFVWYKIKNAWNYSRQPINPPSQLGIKYNKQGEATWVQLNRDKMNYMNLKTSRFFFYFK